MKTPIRHVSRNVGMNPVARAVAKQKLTEAITSYRISIYFNEQGEDACSDYLTMSTMIDATMGGMSDGSSLDYRKLKSGMSVIAQAALRGWTWDKDDTVTLDCALAIVLVVFPSLPPQVANASIRRVIA